jgi:hypothetical protein
MRFVFDSLPLFSVYKFHFVLRYPMSLALCPFCILSLVLAFM